MGSEYLLMSNEYLIMSNEQWGMSTGREEPLKYDVGQPGELGVCLICLIFETPTPCIRYNIRIVFDILTHQNSN